MFVAVSDPVVMPFEGQSALVTGASSGIGRALAIELARGGARVVLSGRDLDRLDGVAGQIRGFGGDAEAFPGDLTEDPARRALVAELRRRGPLPLLVHSAGVCTLDAVADTSEADLDLNWAVNLRAPFLLTRDLLPHVLEAKGQIVFVNSGAGLSASPSWGAYAASKHGLKALADSLRGEVRGQGVRVLTAYPGRTASPMQAAVKAREGDPYHPGSLIQPADVSRMVTEALALPRTAHVTEINVRSA